MTGRKKRAAQTIPTARAPRSVARSSWSGRSMARRVSYPIRSMSNRGVGMRRAHAVRVRQGLPPPKAAGSPGFAAVLSGLLPGLGQAYQGRWVRGILMVLLPIFAVLLAGTFIAIADPLTSLVLRNAPQPLIANAQEPLVSWSGTERLNVLLLGVDARGDGSTTDNTDTMIVLSLDPVNKTAAMLSLPRDIWINKPGVFVDKINAAYAFGGPDLTKKVVEDLLRIKLHAYALVDFEAFTRIVDSVGGVVVDVQRPVRRRLPALRAPVHRRRRRLLPRSGRREGPRARSAALLRSAGEGRGRLGRGPRRGRRAGGRAECRRSARRAGLHGHKRVERAGGALGGVRAYRREALHRQRDRPRARWFAGGSAAGRRADLRRHPRPRRHRFPRSGDRHRALADRGLHDRGVPRGAAGLAPRKPAVRALPAIR